MPAGYLSAFVCWAGGDVKSKHKDRRSAKGKAELVVGGRYVPEPGGDVWPYWVERRLRPGDEITIRFLDASSADPPTRETVYSKESVAKRERAYYERLKKKLERAAPKRSASSRSRVAKRGRQR